MSIAVNAALRPYKLSSNMSHQDSGEGWYVEVTDQPLDISKYTQLVTDPAAGAISSFIGTTRNNFQDKSVLKLEYEAYGPMALTKMKVCSRTSTSKSRDMSGSLC